MTTESMDSTKAPTEDTKALHGRVVALPETRELARMASLLEETGARVLTCPLVAILDAPDPAPVDNWLDTLTADGFDDLVFLTGEGLRRLLSRAQARGSLDAVCAALGRARKITRGPKPARALHEVGLSTDLSASTPTSRGVIDTLSALDLAGRRIGVQLYGTEPNLPLVNFLAQAGAVVTTVAPYIYAPQAHEDKVVELIAALSRGDVDAIAFTSASQVDRLFEVAETRALQTDLRAGLARAKVAAIGPVVVEALADRSVATDIAPPQPFVLRRLVKAIAEAVGPAT